MGCNLLTLLSFFRNGDVFSDDIIESLTSNFQWKEVNKKKGGRKHSHVFIQIKNYSEISLDLKWIREKLKKLFGFNLCVNVKIARTTLPLEEYISKDNE